MSSYSFLVSAVLSDRQVEFRIHDVRIRAEPYALGLSREGKATFLAYVLECTPGTASVSEGWATFPVDRLDGLRTLLEPFAFRRADYASARKNLWAVHAENMNRFGIS